MREQGTSSEAERSQRSVKAHAVDQGVMVLSYLIGGVLVALLVTAVANTAANRRLTFGLRGTDDALRHHAGGLIAFGVGLALTSGSLWLLHTYSDPSRTVEVAVLVVANAVSTLVRFLALRQLMARRR